MPAIYDLANRGLLPPGFSLVGFARRDWADQDFTQIVHDAVKEHARTPFREETWEQLNQGFRFVPGTFNDDAAFRRLRRDHRGARRVARHVRQPRVLPVHPARLLPGRGRPAQGARPGRARGRQLAAGGHREAVRPRPRLGPPAQRGGLRGLPARVGVPHRPLPRQGDGAEHPGVPVRQRDVRAALELELRRPRADHDGRGHRHRRPGRLLRRHRRGPRRDPEPPAAADGADRHGGPGVVRRPQPAAGEAEGALRGRPCPSGSTCTPRAVSTSPAGRAGRR